MSTVMVSYDLNIGWSEVQKIAFANGWYNLLNTTQGQKQAPNTVVFCDNVSELDALSKFKTIVAQASAKLGKTIQIEKVIAVTMGPLWSIISDKP